MNTVVRIGHVSTENKENLITFKDEKLFYSITDGKEPRVIIYKDSPDKPLVECELKLGNDRGILFLINLPRLTRVCSWRYAGTSSRSSGMRMSPRYARS